MSYQALAAVYDLLMEEIDYQQWADYIHSLLEEQHCPGKRLLDLGCGTGQHHHAAGAEGIPHNRC